MPNFLRILNLGGKKKKNNVFEEEFIPLLMVTIDNGQDIQDHVPDNIIVQDAIAPVQDNVQEVSVPVEVNAPVEQTQQPQELVPLRRSIRERRSAIPDDYVVYLQEHEFDIGLVEDDPINFTQVKQSSNSQMWINAMNEEMKSMRDNSI